MASDQINFESVTWDVLPHIGHTAIPTVSLCFAWIVWALVIIASIAVARKARLVPGGLQVVFEMMSHTSAASPTSSSAPKPKNSYPLFIGLFFFILIGNLIGFVPGLTSPTSDPNLTFGARGHGLPVFHFSRITDNGISAISSSSRDRNSRGYMFPISILLSLTEIISFFTRPLKSGTATFLQYLFKGTVSWNSCLAHAPSFS